MIFRWQMVSTSFIGTLVNIIFTQMFGLRGITTQAVQINALVMIGLPGPLRDLRHDRHRTLRQAGELYRAVTRGTT